ncbi:MAG: hypothetical protein IKZ45_00045 [Fibrobacter sp.]|nr:hypothetical protein [Fibrobacter sp.]
MKTLEKFSFAVCLLMFVAGTSVFVACGDDSSSDSGKETGSNDGPKEGDECSEDLQEARVFLKKTQSYYVCIDGKLVPVDEDKDSSGGDSSKSSSSAGDKTSSSGEGSATSSSSTGNATSSSGEKTAGSSSSVHVSLSGCDADQEGSYIYLENTNQYFVCKDSEWKETEKAGEDIDLDKIRCTTAGGDSLTCFVETDPVESSSSLGKYDVEFGSTFTDARDGQVYRQVVIGDQLWMAQNLNYKTAYSVCPEDADGVYCDKYGRLYPYSLINQDSRIVLDDSLCPAGWALPTLEQWDDLLWYVDDHNGDEGVGKSLKAKEGWMAAGTVVEPPYSDARIAVASGEDKFGFSALPAGSRWEDQIYTHDETRFWAKSNRDLFENWRMAPYSFIGVKLAYDSDDATLDSNSYGSNGFSVRCISVDYAVFKGGDGYCTEKRDGDMVKYEYGHAVCDKGVWRTATIREDSLGTCSDSLQGRIKTYYDSTCYRNREACTEYWTCDKKHWREANEQEEFVGQAESHLGKCSGSNYGKAANFMFYEKETSRMTQVYAACDKDGWREATGIEANVGVCTAEKEGEIGEYGYYPKQYAACEKGSWRELTYQEEMTYRFGKCTADIKDSVAFQGGVNPYGICDEDGWRVVTVEENVKGLPCVEDAKLVKGNIYGYYVCKGDSLWGASYYEQLLEKGCSSVTEGDSVFISQEGVAIEFYKCMDNSWQRLHAVDSTVYGSFTDERDGKTYRTVQIGEQTWLGENLNYEMEDSYCYNDSSKYCETYGRLYKLKASRTACPDGWHLPSMEEWESLPITENVRGKLWDLSDFSWGGNKLGFSALPAGYGIGYDKMTYKDINKLTEWWASDLLSENDFNYGYAFGMANDPGATENVFFYYFALSVRCVKDAVTVTDPDEEPDEDSGEEP